MDAWLGSLAALFLIVFLVNLMPAFGPPTWSIIVLFGLQTDHPIAPTVLVAAIAAASGRFIVAIISWLPAGLGFWWQLWDRDKLTWHDRVSGTRLVYYPKPKKKKKKKKGNG